MDMNEECNVCQRVAFGDIVRLGQGAWRHDDCCIGSEAWALYFETLPPCAKAKLAELYRCFIGVSVYYQPTHAQREGLNHVDHHD